jgi:hypothetical protein
MTFISGGAHKKGEGDDDEDVGEGREEEMVHICCMCMVRHKGATLWVSRGNSLRPHLH